MKLRARGKPPAGEFTARVEALSHDGRGVARGEDGKAILIDGALPGEEVAFQYRARHSKYDEGRLQTLLSASPERVTPRCPHFGVCGGCGLQHLEAGAQLAYKQQWLLNDLAHIGKVEPRTVLEPLTGPIWGYRRKARLGAKQVLKKGKVVVGFRERATPYVADLSTCDVLDPRVGGLLDELGRLVGELSIAARLPQIEVAAGDDAVALCFRVLDPPTPADIDRLIAFGQRHGFLIHLQPKGPETTALLWPERGQLSYRLEKYGLEMEFLPHHFVQINAAINQAMVERASDLLEVKPTDRVLDLFCGLGNFALALARVARDVIGVEGDLELVKWAERNAKRNGIDNARFFVADLNAGIENPAWTESAYDKILLDPPRSGALALLPLIARLGARRLVYVSCHPATLARDAGELVHRFGYKLVSAGVMDMFPHTVHVESIALFER